MLVIRNYLPTDEGNVINLWQECGLLMPWNNPYEDIRRKYKNSAELFFVGLLESEIVATIWLDMMDTVDGFTIWR